VCAHSIPAKSARCQFLSDYCVCFKSMSPFHYFLYLTNALFFSLTPRTITYPMASNASSPKAFHTVAYFISVSLIVFKTSCCVPIRYQSCVLIHFGLVCRRLRLFLCFVFFPHRLPCCRASLARHYHQSVHRVILNTTATTTFVNLGASSLSLLSLAVRKE